MRVLLAILYSLCLTGDFVTQSASSHLSCRLWVFPFAHEALARAGVGGGRIKNQEITRILSRNVPQERVLSCGTLGWNQKRKTPLKKKIFPSKPFERKSRTRTQAKGTDAATRRLLGLRAHRAHLRAGHRHTLCLVCVRTIPPVKLSTSFSFQPPCDAHGFFPSARPGSTSHLAQFSSPPSCPSAVVSASSLR